MGREIGRLVRRAALVKASAADLRVLGGLGGGSGGRRGADRDDANDPGLAWLRRHAPTASWLVTRAAGRATAVGPHGEVHEPALRARCVDATGAGDAFIAGALATLVAARAAPGSSVWGAPRLWRAVLRAGHIMGKKAIARPGAVAGLVDLGRARAVVEGARRLA